MPDTMKLIVFSFFTNRCLFSRISLGLYFWCAALLAQADLPKAELIEVYKSERTMYLVHDNVRYAQYAISLGDAPIGHKQQEGDERTPEGRYTIDFKNSNSRYHLSLRISYPNEADKAVARELGVSPGGDIFIHGLPNGFGWSPAAFSGRDWTDGCIAVTNKEIDEIWRLVETGTPIEIFP
jgi:murein L,D-transpeptidase YafK